MRILIANDSRIDGGGVGTYLASLITLLETHGHAVALLHDGPDDETSANRLRVGEAWSISDTGLDKALANVRAWRPDVCYSHNMRRARGRRTAGRRVADREDDARLLRDVRQRPEGLLVSARPGVRAPLRPRVSRACICHDAAAIGIRSR